MGRADYGASAASCWSSCVHSDIGVESCRGFQVKTVPVAVGPRNEEAASRELTVFRKEGRVRSEVFRNNS